MGLISSFFNWLFNDDDELVRKLPEVSYMNFVTDDRVFRSKFFRPSKAYVKNLQFCYLELRAEYGKKFLFDAEAMQQQYNTLLARTCELERNHAEADTKKQIYENQVTTTLGFMKNTEKKNAVLQEHGYEKIEQKEQARNGHLFATEDGSDGKVKKKVAAAMKEYGFSNQDIAETIKVKIESVGPYISEAKKHYRLGKYADGEIFLKWDEKWGNDYSRPAKMFEGMWEYVDIDDAQNKQEFAIGGDIATLPDEMGTIHHGLEKPIKNG